MHEGNLPARFLNHKIILHYNDIFSLSVSLYNYIARVLTRDKESNGFVKLKVNFFLAMYSKCNTVKPVYNGH